MKILTIQLSAGKIKRYHTHYIIGEQTVGEHTYGVVQIMRHITADNWSKHLMKAALDHDAMEFFTGDIPFPAKEQFPVLRQATDLIEEAMGKQYPELLPNLTEEEAVCLKAADLLEMAYFGLGQWQMGSRFGLIIIHKTLTSLKDLNSTLLPQAAKELIIELEGEITNVSK